MKTEKQAKSFQKRLLTALLCIAIPLSALLIGNNVYSVRVFNEKIAESNTNALAFMADRMQRELEAVDNALLGIVAGNVDFITLSGGAGQLQAHLSSLALFNQLKAVLPSVTAADAFFIYSVPSNTERDFFTGGYAYEKKRAVRAYVREAVAQNSIAYGGEWFYAEIDAQYYLFRFYGGRSTYLVMMVPLAAQLYPVGPAADEAETHVLFSTQDGMPLTGRDYVEAHGLELTGDYGSYFYAGGAGSRHMVLGRDIPRTNCRLVLLIQGAGVLDALNFVQIFLLAVSFGAVLLIPLLFFWLNSTILSPLREITATMNRIRAGDLEAQAQGGGTVKEFRLMNETFNGMMQQIKSLRIASYEHEIATQKAQLRYLQLQIKPHFFLNCLKSVYAFSQQRQYEKLQKMILAFSKHIRYIFQDSMDFLPISMELAHVKNYLEIQGISAVHPPVFHMDADPALLGFPIPPLLIQTFVENAVKHETNPDKALEIRIKLALLHREGKCYVHILVADNGTGFSEQILEEINQPDSGIYAHRHVGLNNVKHRLRLIYGEDVHFAFYNGENGSVSDIMIPVNPEEYQASAGCEEGEQT